MRFKLRDFQEDAVCELAGLLDQARYGARRGKNQAVGLTATTGAGKTVIVAALIEQVLCGSDDGTEPPDPGAVFLWITDMPKLNAQTRDKMWKASDALGLNRLVEVTSTFDAVDLAPGKVYFLNTQLLGSKGTIVQPSSPKHRTPFWDTVRNTVENPGRTVYLVVDEAHRGMTEGKDREEASSIVQRFIKGIPDVMPPVPIVLGISATPERYQRVIENSGRTTSSHDVPPGDVRRSGLIKDRVAADAAAERQTDALALLRVAATAWHESTQRWAAYHAATSDDVTAATELLVVPAFIIQVENEDDGSLTKTNLSAVINIITDVAGVLPEAAFRHSFGEESDLWVGTRKVRYIEPSKIAGDSEALVILFKTGLGTGWDCPRAEVLFSFRRAVDATSIAQTIGRMVRTPLARRVEEDERLNSVDVFLPHYQRKSVEAVVTYLRDAGDVAVADSIADRTTLVDLPRRGGIDGVVAALETVPSFTVPTVRERQEMRRLVDLARRLSADGIAPGAFDAARQDLAAFLVAKRDTLASDPTFMKAVNDEGEIEIERIEWAVGEATVTPGHSMVLPASEDTITMLYNGARRIVGGDTAVAYCQARISSDPSSSSTSRLEIWTLTQWPGVLPALNDLAADHISALFKTHGSAINALPSSRRVAYDRIRGAAPDPSLKAIPLPEVIQVSRGTDEWAKHLYANDEGLAPISFKSSWETETVTVVLKDPTVLAWLRNNPRDDWALCVPWRDRNLWRPFYPDFLVVREANGGLVVDILDPHDHGRPDAPGKARGLAAYARDHGTGLGHIDLIAKVGGRMRTLHLEDEKTRKAVDAVTSNEMLLALYEKA